MQGRKYWPSTRIDEDKCKRKKPVGARRGKSASTADSRTHRGGTDTRSLDGAGRALTTCGHQNQRPISAAIDGVMKARITNVSNSRPKPIVVPIWATTTMALTIM